MRVLTPHVKAVDALVSAELDTVCGGTMREGSMGRPTHDGFANGPLIATPLAPVISEVGATLYDGLVPGDGLA